MRMSGRESSRILRARSKPARRLVRSPSARCSQFLGDAIIGTCEHAMPATICAMVVLLSNFWRSTFGSLFGFNFLDSTLGVHHGGVILHALAGGAIREQKQQRIDAAVVHFADVPGFQEFALRGVELIAIEYCLDVNPKMRGHLLVAPKIAQQLVDFIAAHVCVLLAEIAAYIAISEPRPQAIRLV